MGLSETLRAERKRAGLLQKQVAGAIGVTLSHYNNIEAGRRPLLDRHLDSLPEAMRDAVVQEVIGELVAKQERLRALLKGA